MNTARTVIAAVTLATIVGAGFGQTTTLVNSTKTLTLMPHTDLAADVTVNDSPRVVADPADHELISLGTWALGRFEAAGLELPPVEIHMHRSSDACGGNDGSFNPGMARINVCVAERLVVLHELGHAWAHDNLSEEGRAQFVASGGHESWNAPETAWSDRGSEHAANVLAWGLLEQPLSLVTPDGPIAQANADFRMLTGIDAPRIVSLGQA